MWRYGRLDYIKYSNQLSMEIGSRFPNLISRYRTLLSTLYRTLVRSRSATPALVLLVIQWTRQICIIAKGTARIEVETLFPQEQSLKEQ